ncbi:hypothetical protein [uncultured Alistipes sp.]|uniref:hypothetical protein n=1 Tax=uncultured Alistipes sp. TaxID=538949 RepID=UPI00258423C3|nr:hypothetical protein [uncultured Alistipes sp.]
MTAKTNRQKPAEAAIAVPIVRYDGSEYTLQNEEQLQVCIHKSLITDNGLTFDLQNRLLIPESLYDIWFGRAREEQRRKAEKYLWKVYSEHIPLFWHHRKQILSDPKLFVTETPLRAYGFGKICLGILVKAWIDYPNTFCKPCPKCKGRSLVFSFSGSPMSGMSSHSVHCLDCGTVTSGISGGEFGAFRAAIRHIVQTSLVSDYSGAQLLDDVITRLKSL